MTKDYIIKLLDEIEPYEYLIATCNGREVYLCKEDSLFLFAVSISRSEYENYMVPVDVPDKFDIWAESRRITFEGENYIIDKDISKIQYDEDMIIIEVMSFYTPGTYYLPYDNIDYIIKPKDKEGIIYKYNKFQWDIAK
jgi:hypothetical protein